MKKFALIATAILGLSACVAPIEHTGAVVVPVPVGVPVLVTNVKDKNDSMHVCKIKAFTDTYTAENANRGKARLDVKRNVPPIIMKCFAVIQTLNAPNTNNHSKSPSSWWAFLSVYYSPKS